VTGTPPFPGNYWVKVVASIELTTSFSFAASQDTFFSTCANLFERMINTVPSGVTLTNIITPIPVKPAVYLDIQEDGSLNVFGEVRVSLKYIPVAHQFNGFKVLRYARQFESYGQICMARP
jgi:hypothetical protein